MARGPSPVASPELVAATATAAKKRDAAPPWDFYKQFGEQGFKRDARGRIKGYQMPRPKDDKEAARVRNKVVEAWEPHRRVSIDAGAEAHAKVRTTRLRNKKTGQTMLVPEAFAEKKARAGGMVELTSIRANLVMRDGEWWRYMGGGKWVKDKRKGHGPSAVAGIHVR